MTVIMIECDQFYLGRRLVKEYRKLNIKSEDCFKEINKLNSIRTQIKETIKRTLSSLAKKDQRIKSTLAA